MVVQILLASGACPRYFAGFGQTESGSSYVIATPQLFTAKHYSVTEANDVLNQLLPSWPLAQISQAIGD
ncbi:hypothetical protein NL53_18995 [Vibrio variabilis]|uniref:Uncharacterized protein n=1 Tax=Vibrio variabilis TaxID=990271 RepID=A0ABR4Y684_9VIBR|nr:hypothetical protein [Vibrio variabilis]KHA58981.1 hypothetical protein NL53_18995 [Vibrio variabilis]